MMVPPDRRLISGLPVTEPSLGREAETGQEFQRPVNRRHPDFWIAFRNLRMNLRKAFMAGRVEKHLEDLLPLFGRLQPFFGDPRF